MDFSVINKDNFLIYATKKCDVSMIDSLAEMNQELRRFMSVKRLLLKFSRNPDKVNIRILLNHIITMNNLFGSEATRRLLFYYCPPTTHKMLCSLLKYINIFEVCPETTMTELDYDEKMEKALAEI